MKNWRTKKKAIFLLWIGSFGFLGSSLILIALAQQNRQAVEAIYSRGIYRRLVNQLTGISNMFPFSLAEVVIIGQVVVLLGLLIFQIIRLLQVKKKGLQARLPLWSLIFFFASFHFWYYQISWGLNYYRQGAEVVFELQTEEIEAADLGQVYHYFVTQTNRLRQELELLGINPSAYDKQKIRAIADQGYQQLHPAIDDSPVLVKPMLLKRTFTKSGYTGIYLYLCGEPTINPLPPAFSLPFTACHEIAHQKGFAAENEANFVGFLACVNHSEPLFQYSGAMAMLSQLSSPLAKQEPELLAQLNSQLSPLVKQDLQIRREFWAQNYQESAGKLHNQINDWYLKANQQTAGIESYNQVVDLLLRYYKKQSGQIFQ